MRFQPTASLACARFAAAEARAVSRLTHCNQGAVSYACLPYPAQNRTS
jgi:hypothetical protein